MGCFWLACNFHPKFHPLTVLTVRASHYLACTYPFFFTKCSVYGSIHRDEKSDTRRCQCHLCQYCLLSTTSCGSDTCENPEKSQFDLPTTICWAILSVAPQDVRPTTGDPAVGCVDPLMPFISEQGSPGIGFIQVLRLPPIEEITDDLAIACRALRQRHAR